MRALVTGATGRVGHAVMLALLERGDDVRALVRNPERATQLLPPDVELVHGDVLYPSTLRPALAGCELVFNAHGVPEQWLADEALFDRVNAYGARNVVREASGAGVRRVVHTSTIDVFHTEPGGEFDEAQLADYPKATAYERSKQLAERLVLDTATGSTEVVIVNPASVYGPGPGGDATSIERGLLRPLIEKRRLELPALPPGGLALVYSAGLAKGHLLAAERGTPGERYILCDGYASFRELAERAVEIAGRGRVPPVMPPRLARAFAAAGESVARVIRRPPLLPKGQLEFFLWAPHPRSDRAQRELGWEPTALEDGLRAAVAAVA